MKAKKVAAIMLCAALGAAMVTGVSVSAKDKDGTLYMGRNGSSGSAG